MSHLRMRVLFAVLLSLAWSCGDDDSEKKGAGGTGGQGSSSDGGPLSGGNGDMEEGFPCGNASDCVTGLACVENIFADQNGNPIGVCGRGCETDPDCKDDEICLSYTGMDQDKHCVNQVSEEYGECGVGYTSVCSKDRSCLYFPNSPYGVCIDTCAIGATADAGTEDDAGAKPAVDAGVPSGVVSSCSTGETCIDGVLADAMSNEGVCGFVIERGGECGLADGKYCHPGDICAPENPDDLKNSQARCFENCGDSGKCSKGTCVVVGSSFAYCM